MAPVTNGFTHQRAGRETERSDPKETGETAETVDPDFVNPGNVDPSEVVRTADGELIHEPTGLILEDE